jgi:hypothetical protein
MRAIELAPRTEISVAGFCVEKARGNPVADSIRSIDGSFQWLSIIILCEGVPQYICCGMGPQATSCERFRAWEELGNVSNSKFCRGAFCNAPA